MSEGGARANEGKGAENVPPLGNEVAGVHLEECAARGPLAKALPCGAQVGGLAQDVDGGAFDGPVRGLPQGVAAALELDELVKGFLLDVGGQLREFHCGRVKEAMAKHAASPAAAGSL